MYVYIKSEPTLWTVGFYNPKNNEWHPESDHPSPNEAADRVTFLNGPTEAERIRVDNLTDVVSDIRDYIMEVEPQKEGAEKMRATIHQFLKNYHFAV